MVKLTDMEDFFEDEDGLTDDEMHIKYLAKKIDDTAVGFLKWIAKNDWMSIWVEDRWLWECQREGSKDIGYFTEELLYSIYKKELENE